MYTPETSFGGYFTKEGRLKNQWARGLREKDILNSLNDLRRVQQKLLRSPEMFGHLWMPFLETYLDPERVGNLTESDMAALIEMGNTLVKNPSTKVRAEDVWQRIVQAHDARKEELKARSLLTHMYRSPSTSRERKAKCARDLGKRRARGDEHINIYIDYLRQIPEPSREYDIFKLLSDICIVDFDMDSVRLTRAAEVARDLADNNVQVDNFQSALGVYELLVKNDPSRALNHFDSAVASQPLDRIAMIGLVTCLIKTKDYDRAGKMITDHLSRSPHSKSGREYVKFLCYLAISAHKSEKPDKCIDMLRLAASVGVNCCMYDTHAPTLLKYAKNIELDIAISRLLSYIFPENTDKLNSSKRYQFLRSVIEECPALSKYLLKEDKSSALLQWQQILEKYGSDMQFQHRLASTYQEQAVKSFNNGNTSERLWIVSTAVWLCLLCSDKFWAYFSKARVTERESNIRKDLKEEQEIALFHESWQSILQFHNNYGSQDYAARRYTKAIIHLKCLDLCRKDGKTIAKILSNFGIAYNLEVISDINKERLDKVKSMAEDILSNWGSTLVNQAEEITNDPEAIENLPKGIIKNYQGGIGHLQHFIDVGFPVSSVLCKSLHWYWEWDMDLYHMRDFKNEKELMVPWNNVANMLAPLCTKGRDYMPENQELANNYFNRGYTSSTHFALRGFTFDDLENKIKWYKESLAWKDDDDVRERLKEVTQEMLKEKLYIAIKCSKCNQFIEAYSVLDNLEKMITENNQLNITRAEVHFTHAKALIGEHKCREAVPHVFEALRLMPSNKEFIDLAKEALVWYPNYNDAKHHLVGIEVLNDGVWYPDYDDAKECLKEAMKKMLQEQLSIASKFSERNKFEEAYNVLDYLEKQITDDNELNMTRAKVHFTHAKALMNENRFREALLHAREALHLMPGKKDFLDLEREIEKLVLEEDNSRKMSSDVDYIEEIDGIIDIEKWLNSKE